MANEKHIEVVKRGIKATWEWDENNPDARLDLAGANLSRANLCRAFLSGANLSGAQLYRARCIRANLTDAQVEGCDVTEIHFEGLTGLPKTPKTLIRNRKKLTGHEAETFFTMPAIVEVYLTTALTDQTLGGYYLHLAEMRRESVGGEVFLRGHRHEEGGSVLEFQAPDYKAIYNVLPDLLAPFPQSRAIDLQESLKSVSQDERDGVLNALVALETQTPQRAWQFAERLVMAFPDFLDARVTAIKSTGNRVGPQDGFLLKISTDEDKLRELTQHISPGTLSILVNKGTVQMIEDKSTHVNANQVGAVGPNAQSHGNNFQQIWNQAKGELDLNALAQDLAKLRDGLQEEASEVDHDVAIGEVAQAEKAAQAGDGPKALEHLSNAGKWVFDTGTKIGIGVATAYAKS